MTIIENDVRRTTDEEEDVDLTTEGTWKMDPSLKQRWVTALRSGKYKQGRVSFKEGDRYCALGVLCLVAGQPTSIPEETAGNWPFVNDSIRDRRTVDQVWMRNDDCYTFEQLADWIEENVA